jgi:hypothetical protein
MKWIMELYPGMTEEQVSQEYVNSHIFSTVMTILTVVIILDIGTYILGTESVSRRGERAVDS